FSFCFNFLLVYGIVVVQTNGSAKLKQIKLDVRREQWLSRVKKGSEVDSNGRLDHCPSSKNIVIEENKSSIKENRRKRGEDIEGSCIQGNDSGSIINSSVQNSVDLDESGSDFSGSSSSSSMSACLSGNVSDKEMDGSLDDWEVVADALYANDNLCSVVSESSPVQEAAKKTADFTKPEFKSAVHQSHPNRRAWKPDDVLRPQGLPNLSKQHGSQLNTNWHGNHKTVPFSWQTIMSQPPQCPICYEDLDMTDSSFLPCSCGFHLCLFCHKKIVEADSRCPGCRKPYDHADGNVEFDMGVKAFPFAQSFSMSTGC
ncbi:uncharacterized protein LOC124846223, partial [Vigna umbellata]|uniref:uncharacterized protein LOC124846223 n=1 Tax=Vigna umbellata TaxID=87088 RepID=UPI001F5F9E2D